MKGFGAFLKRSSPTILTLAGGMGVIATAVLAAKATPKAMRLLQAATDEKGEDLTTIETIKIAAPQYIPSAMACVATLTCIFGANILNKKQQASLMSVYMLAENAYKEYSGKVKELMGDEAESKVREAMAKDAIDDEDVQDSDDTYLFFDMRHGVYFESPIDVVKLDDGLECLIVDLPALV